MSWEIKIAKRAAKEMRRIPNKDIERLLFVIEQLRENPYRGDIEKIKGEENVWRRRVGNYRIIYEITLEQKYIYIFQVARRTTTTYRRKK